MKKNPTPPVRRRAIKDEHKQERRQAILDTAWRMFQSAAYEAVTIAGIAEAQGLAKGTIFLYFNTKEELFLAIQEQQLAAWFDAVDSRLEAGAGALTVAEAATLISHSIEERVGVTRLLAILSTVLEQNVGLDSALRFKRTVMERLTRTGGLLERRLPFLRPGQGAQIFLRIQALIVGLRHLADPAPVIQKALQSPDLGAFNIDFDRELSETIAALLRGMEKEM